MSKTKKSSNVSKAKAALSSGLFALSTFLPVHGFSSQVATVEQVSCLKLGYAELSKEKADLNRLTISGGGLTLGATLVGPGLVFPLAIAAGGAIASKHFKNLNSNLLMLAVAIYTDKNFASRIPESRSELDELNESAEIYTRTVGSFLRLKEALAESGYEKTVTELAELILYVDSQTDVRNADEVLDANIESGKLMRNNPFCQFRKLDFDVRKFRFNYKLTRKNLRRKRLVSLLVEAAGQVMESSTAISDYIGSVEADSDLIALKLIEKNVAVEDELETEEDDEIQRI